MRAYYGLKAKKTVSYFRTFRREREPDFMAKER
jgi:hypothetical protein